MQKQICQECGRVSFSAVFYRDDSGLCDRCDEAVIAPAERSNAPESRSFEAAPGGLLKQTIDSGLIEPAFQPLVDLYTGEVLGYEALARGPVGPLAQPAQLFAAARREGMVFELDRACRAAAVTGAHDAGLRTPATLFVNVEPEVLDVTRGGSSYDASAVPAGMRLVVEITERALTARVADLLPIVEQLRAHGIGIALDDVGADRRSLALMPFLRPDVIKLDMHVVQHRPTARIAEIHNAVAAHAEQYGGVVVAEGVETEEHAARARAMGATVGQGWLFGRPGPIGPARPRQSSSVPIVSPLFADARTPFESVIDSRPTRRAAKSLLLSISRELEQRALTLGDSAVLLSTFQHDRFFGPLQAERYAEMSSRLAFVGAFGEGMGTFPASEVRGAHIEPSDPLAEEWDVIVVDPHFAGALTARDLGDQGCPDMERRFDFKLTHDRDLVIRAARSLMARIEPLHRLEHEAPA